MKRNSFEEQYLDVLQNLESAIVQVAREQPKLTDWHAESAVEALMRLYKAEAAGDEVQDPPTRLDPLAEEVYDMVHAMADMRLGRGELTNKDGEPVEIPFKDITVQEMYNCLKRIRKSIRRWTKVGGRKGYLRYIDEFFPS